MRTNLSAGKYENFEGVFARGEGRLGRMCMESERGTHKRLSLSPANAER